jgi:hypothetical protein
MFIIIERRDCYALALFLYSIVPLRTSNKSGAFLVILPIHVKHIILTKVNVRLMPYLKITPDRDMIGWFFPRSNGFLYFAACEKIDSIRI